MFTISAFILATIASSFAAYWFAWERGRRYGRDEQWVDDFLDAARREYERRDNQGRFVRRPKNRNRET